MNNFNAELERISKEYSRPNWDGYSAEAINSKTIDVVRQFAQAIPFTIPVPDIVPEPTGDIGLEWSKDSNETFVISLAHDYTIQYFGVSGNGHFVSGTSKFENNTVPPIVLAILQTHVAGM